MAYYGENEQQGKFWNEKPGQAWVKNDAAMHERLSNVSEILFDDLPVSSGMAALDIGCGAGASTRRIAGLVGHAGHAIGVDISQTLLDLALTAAASEKVGNAEFIQADAQSYDFTPSHFDIAISRFGVMFFENPVRAFANIRTSLKPDGHMRFVCWAPLAENDFFRAPLEITKSLVDVNLPEIGREPGPLAFGDKDYLSDILKGAGFSHHHIETHKTTISTADTAEENAALLMQIGMASRAIKEAEPSDEVLALISQALEKDSVSRQNNGLIEYGATLYRVDAVF